MTDKPKLALVADFTEDLRESYLKHIASGLTSAATCRELDINPLTPYHYCEKDLSFRDRVSRAREIGTDAQVDKLGDILTDEPDVNRARLKSDNIKWIASKLSPQKYGDRIDVNMRHSVDLDSAMSEAMDRVRTKRPQVVDITPQSVDEVATVDDVDIFT